MKSEFSFLKILCTLLQNIMSQPQKDEKANEEPTDNQIRSQDTTSQYQIRPSVGKSFPIVSIREIINEVLLQILDGEVFLYFVLDFD